MEVGAATVGTRATHPRVIPLPAAPPRRRTRAGARVRVPRIAAGAAGWALAALLIAAALWVPIVVVGAHVLTPAGETWSHLVDTVLGGYVATSALLVFGTGALAFAIGVGAAWLVTACEFRGRRIVEVMLMLPLAVPAYVAAYTYAGMLDVTGPMQRIVRTLIPALSDSMLHITVAGPWVAMLIFALVLYPYVYVIARSSFRRQSRTVLEASRVLGRGPWSTFLRVALPLARPAVAAGLVLVALEVLNDYGTVRFLGVTTFTTGIFRAWSGLGDLDAAIRLAAILLLCVLAVLVFERMQRGRRRMDAGIETDKPMQRWRLHGIRGALAFAFCALPILFGFLVPVGQLGWWAVRTASHVVDWSFMRLMVNSFGLAIGAALLGVALALVVAYAARVVNGRAVRVAARVAVLGYSVPGAVIAIGVLVPLGALDRGIGVMASSLFGISTGLLIGGTVAAVLYAYAVRFMAVAYLPIEAGFERECRDLDAASRTLGIGTSGTLRRVGLPLLRGALLGAAILVFVDVLKELPATLILRPFNFDTLATRAFQLASDEQIAESACAALILIGAGVVSVLGLDRLLGGRTTR